MLLTTEIIAVLKALSIDEFILQESPVSFYSKNGLSWVKISMVYRIDDAEIRYVYHGYLSDDDMIKSRDCHSERHREISKRITIALNQNQIGQKLNAHF
jgi:hypothetical protein